MPKSDKPAKQAPPKLGNSAVDYIVAGLRGAAGSVPVAGSVMAEIIGSLVPNQRMDRVARYVAQLAARIDAMDGALQRAMKLEPESIALIEDGAYAAARATTQERTDRIVHCVANGLEHQERDKLFKRRLLGLFNELDDGEAALLFRYYDRALMRTLAEDTARKEKVVKSVPQARVNAGVKVDVTANSKAAVGKLERLGLVRFQPKLRELPKPERPRQRPGILLPVIGRDGQPEGTFRITYLGLRLLESVGLIHDMPRGAEGLL